METTTPKTPVVELSDSEFDEFVLESDAPVIVDFFAPWCGPCRRIAKDIERLGAEHPEVRVAKLNVDEAPNIAARYDVISIPTIIRFESGRKGPTVIGGMPYDQLLLLLGIEVPELQR